MDEMFEGFDRVEGAISLVEDVLATGNHVVALRLIDFNGELVESRGTPLQIDRLKTLRELAHQSPMPPPVAAVKV